MDVPSSSSTQPVKISFGVKKKLEAKVEVVNVVAADESEHSDDEAEIAAKRRKLTHFENGVLAGDDEEDSRKKKKETMVIPLVKEHDWRVAKLLEMEKNGTISDEDRARLAILTEGQPFSISTTETEEVSLSVSVEVGATVKEVEDADYGQIPIESYGLAILRGCGWKDGEGIGKNPQVVPLRVSQQRPKGLGLGAKPPKQEKKQAHNKQEEEELSGDVKQGSKVKITVKPHIGKYGVVEGRDDDNNSCFVRLALGNAKVRVSLFCVQKVTTKEYEKNAKVLNQANYEQEAKRLEVERESYRDKEKDRRNGETKNGKGRLEDDDDIIIEDVRDRRELWARPDLIVRFVNPDYKKGRYMSQKMRVVDVADYKNLTLEDDDRKQHYQIKQSWIETVIPRSAGERVMIVRGKGRGQPAVMEAKNKDLQKCVVRIVHSEEVLRVPFDDLCMWTPSTHYDSDQ